MRVPYAEFREREDQRVREDPAAGETIIAFTTSRDEEIVQYFHSRHEYDELCPKLPVGLQAKTLLLAPRQ